MTAPDDINPTNHPDINAMVSHIFKQANKLHASERPPIEVMVSASNHELPVYFSNPKESIIVLPKFFVDMDIRHQYMILAHEITHHFRPFNPLETASKAIETSGLTQYNPSAVVLLSITGQDKLIPDQDKLLLKKAFFSLARGTECTADGGAIAIAQADGELDINGKRFTITDPGQTLQSAIRDLRERHSRTTGQIERPNAPLRAITSHPPDMMRGNIQKVMQEAGVSYTADLSFYSDEDGKCLLYLPQSKESKSTLNKD